MTGSERKVMDGEGRSENQRANSFLDVLVLGDLPDVYIPEQMPGANLVPSANRVYVKMKHENRHSWQKKLRLVFSFEVEATIHTQTLASARPTKLPEAGQ